MLTRKIIKAILFILPIPLMATELDDTQLSCLLEPSSEIQISSQVSGIVSKVNAERGGSVAKGQLLIALESGLEKAALNSVKARAEFTIRKLERNQDLLRKGLLSEYERDELLTDRELADLATREAEERLKQRKIYSPIDAIVVERHVSIGEYVGSEPVLELVALDPLHAEIVLRSDHYGTLEPGMLVDVLVGPDGKPYQGIVKIVDKVIDAASGTYGVRVEVPNPGARLPAGLKCRAAFNVAKAE